MMTCLWEINMHADNLAEYTGPKHVSNQKRYDGFKGILGPRAWGYS